MEAQTAAPAGTPAVGTIDPNAVYELPGGIKIEGKELLSGGLRQQDYTRKTMELAEERKQMAAIKPQVEALVEKAAQMETFIQGDPEVYTKFVEVAGGKIPVEDRRPAKTEKKVEQPVAPVRNPHYDAEIERLNRQTLAIQGDQEIRTFADANHLDYEFVAETLLPIAAEEYSPKLPARRRLEKAWKEYQGEHAQELAQKRFASRVEASTFGGSSRSPGGPGASEEAEIEAVKKQLSAGAADNAWLQR